MNIQTDPLAPQAHWLREIVRCARGDAATAAAAERPHEEDIHPDTRPPARAACDVCRAAAHVLVLEGYVAGQPVLRRFCLRCAAVAAPYERAPGDHGGQRIGVHVLFALVGLVLCVVGLGGDFLIPERHSGFGWHQQLGVAIGALLFVFGLFLRAEVIALGGAFLLGAAACADWFGLTHGSGVGWKQQCLLAAGALCLLIAGALRVPRCLRRACRGHAPDGAGPEAKATTCP